MRRRLLMGCLMAVALLPGCSEQESAKAPPAAQGEGQETGPLGVATVTPPVAVDARSVRRAELQAPPAPPAALGTLTAGAVSPLGSATLLREGELKATPFSDAVSVVRLAAQSRVTLLERRGGWYRVEAAGTQGWLRLLQVRVNEGATAQGGSSDWQQAATLATGRAGSGNVVSTSGLRGLDEAQLKGANPDYDQLEKLDGFGVNQQAAGDYARANGLTARRIGYLGAAK